MPWAFKKGIKSFYSIGETLGTGSFATVKHGVHKKTKEEVAIKIIDKKNIVDEENSLRTETEIMSKVFHPNIIRLLDVFETNDKLYLVMELVTGGELFDSIVERGSYSEADAAKVIRETIEAIQYLHEHNIVHRDLKPENLLYSTKDPATQIIKLADFGLAKVVGSGLDSTMATKCGTPGYVAPEVLLNEGYSKAVDMWSVGVPAYADFLRSTVTTPTSCMIRLCEGIITFPRNTGTISQSQNVVQRLLTVDPKKRMTASECLDHPWITGKTATDTAIPDIISSIKTFNAKRKLKQGILGVIAMNQLKRIAQSP